MTRHLAKHLASAPSVSPFDGDVGKQLIRRLHITGGPGSGKTHLAQRLCSRLRFPHIEIDTVATALVEDMPKPLDMGLLLTRRLELSKRLASEENWISEGSNLDGSIPFLEHADFVIFLNCQWRVAAYRIVMRHIRAELARNNRWPGWANLYRFWRWSGRYYANRNPWRVNEWGTPETEAYHLRRLRTYQEKLVLCRTNAEASAVVDRLLG